MPSWAVVLERVGLRAGVCRWRGGAVSPLVPSLLVRVPFAWNAQTFQGSSLTRQQLFQTPAAPCWMVPICSFLLSFSCRMCSACRPNGSDASTIKCHLVNSSLPPVLMCAHLDFFSNPILGPTCCGKVNFCASVSAEACNSLAWSGLCVCVCWQWIYSCFFTTAVKIAEAVKEKEVVVVSYTLGVASFMCFPLTFV